MADGERLVRYWSPKFPDLWGIQQVGSPVPGKPFLSGAVPVIGRKIGEAAIRLGMTEDWLAELCAVPAMSSADEGILIERSDGIGVLAVVQIVLSDSGMPLGRLLGFEVSRGPMLSEETVWRALRAARLVASLSVREREILALIYQGLTNKAIAFRIRISEKTVEKHRSRVMKKLKAKSAAEMIQVACEATLTGGGAPL